jgi:hypothetical protein
MSALGQKLTFDNLGLSLVHRNADSRVTARDAPWYIVPADDKENARLIVSRIILDTLEGLEMTYPRTTAKRRQELLAIRKQLGG